MVKQRLLDDVVAGIHPPGTMVSLAGLAERYGVSRTPVREALSVLEHEGLVTSFPYQGFLVNSASVGDLKDLYLMREVVETAAARRAAQLATDEQLSDLRDLVDAQESVTHDGYSRSFDDKSRDFHVAIARMSCSPRIESCISEIFRSVARLQYIGVNPPKTDVVRHDHREILAALMSRDPAAAQELMLQHIADLRTHALEALIK